MNALVPTGPGRQIATIAQATQWLVEARDLADVLEFRDQVEAVRHYRQVAGEAVEACNEAAELKVRAERRIGELLKDMPKHEGGRPPKTPSIVEGVSSLADIGIDHKESHRCQRIASLAPETFEQHLADVKGQGEQITTAGLLRLAKELGREAEREEVHEKAEQAQAAAPGVITDLAEVLAAGIKYGCIYADPPWLYGNQRTRGATSDHYPGMTVEEITAMPIAGLAADNAHLHLWTTNGFIEESFAIMREWGFTYKSMFIWVKPVFGMGNYWRVSHEIMLLGVRGSCPFLVHNERSWQEYERGEHSAKPEQVRFIIEKTSPGPRLELFGRAAVPGWTVFGNQIREDLFNRQEKE